MTSYRFFWRRQVVSPCIPSFTLLGLICRGPLLTCSCRACEERCLRPCMPCTHLLPVVCSHIESPLHSLHVTFWWWLWQMLVPPHTLHWLPLRLCSHICDPPHSLLWAHDSCGYGGNPGALAVRARQHGSKVKQKIRSRGSGREDQVAEDRLRVQGIGRKCLMCRP